jgi:hypothetical protein
MKGHNCISLIRPLVYLFGVLLLTTCNAFGQFSYPSDFSNVDGLELESPMQQLGFKLQQLDLALAAEHDERPDLEQHVGDILLEIERIGGNIQAGDMLSDHPYLQDDMANFLNDVRQARLATSRNQPRYYLAGRISGGCVNCHRANR